jgi:hypothetical protein
MEKQIGIIVYHGQVIEVTGIPKGYKYAIVDLNDIP